MSEIQGGRWDRVLRSLFPVKGQAVAPAVGNEIVPVMELQKFDPELHWLRGEALLMGTGLQGGVAGQFCQVNLRNDSDDRMVVLEQIVIAPGDGADLFHLSLGNTAVGVAQTVYGRDPRAGLIILAGAVAGVVRASNLGAALTPAMRYSSPALLENVITHVPIVLPPTYACFISMATANRGLICSFAWRERPFEPGELR